VIDHEDEGSRDMPEDEGIPDLDPAHPRKDATGDPQEGLMAPRDQPRALDHRGTTAEEQREGERLDERLEEEEPDAPARPREDAGLLVEEGSGLIDDEKDEVGEAVDAPEGRSAEEEAVRVEDEPPEGTGAPDSYVEEE
jgi:hypothetical protein